MTIVTLFYYFWMCKNLAEETQLATGGGGGYSKALQETT